MNSVTHDKHIVMMSTVNTDGNRLLKGKTANPRTAFLSGDRLITVSPPESYNRPKMDRMITSN